MILVTGFPGFLASELIIRFLKNDMGTQFLCLVQPKFRFLAEANLDQLETLFPNAKKTVRLIEGDITAKDLGIKDQTLFSSITRIFHFAAVYDLSVTKELATLVNVEGTRNVLTFARNCPIFQRLDYISTCYVSGRYTGVFKESDLEKDQEFNNFYESTKYEAERLVRREMSKGLPATIYRPSIVVGNSQSGETQKFDGPYFVMQWLLRQPKLAFLPRLFHPENFYLNIVPSNYVLDAMAYLAHSASAVGKTFQLADPDPLTISEIITCIGEACQRNVIGIPLPKLLAKNSLKLFPGLEQWLGIPYSALDYFDHPTRYDVTETKTALQNTSIRCPRFSEYAAHLVGFMRISSGIRTKALV